MLRQYLPKGTALGTLTQRECDAIAAKLNHRPRPRLGYVASVTGDAIESIDLNTLDPNPVGILETLLDAELAYVERADEIEKRTRLLQVLEGLPRLRTRRNLPASDATR